MILTRWADLQAAITLCPHIPQGASLTRVSIEAEGQLVRVECDMVGWEGVPMVAYAPAATSTVHALVSTLVMQYLLNTHAAVITHFDLEFDEDDEPMPAGEPRFDA